MDSSQKAVEDMMAFQNKIKKLYGPMISANKPLLDALGKSKRLQDAARIAQSAAFAQGAAVRASMPFSGPMLESLQRYIASAKKLMSFKPSSDTEPVPPKILSETRETVSDVCDSLEDIIGADPELAKTKDSVSDALGEDKNVTSGLWKFVVCHVLIPLLFLFLGRLPTTHEIREREHWEKEESYMEQSLDYQSETVGLTREFFDQVRQFLDQFGQHAMDGYPFFMDMEEPVDNVEND